VADVPNELSLTPPREKKKMQKITRYYSAQGTFNEKNPRRRGHTNSGQIHNVTYEPIANKFLKTVAKLEYVSTTVKKSEIPKLVGEQIK
jgi:hypothetical protein